MLPQTMLRPLASRRCFRPHNTRALRIVRHSQAGGKWGSSEERTAQIKRLISRDRKDFLGSGDDIMDKYTTEFGDSPSSTSTDERPQAPSPATPSPSKVDSASPSPSPFRASSTPSSPFGTPVTQTRSKLEPEGLSPYVSPDPLIAEPKMTLSSFFSGITTIQVVLALSFTLIILLMIATFTFVLNVGAIKLAGLD